MLFSLETSPEEQPESISQQVARLERMAQEFLYRVQARRRRARSYLYLTWFLLFFSMYLATRFLKQVRCAGNLI